MRRRCHNRQGWPADIATSWIDSPNLGDTAKRASLVPVHHGVVNMDSMRQGNPIQFPFTSRVSPRGVDEDRSVHACSVGDGGFMPTRLKLSNPGLISNYSGVMFEKTHSASKCTLPRS